MLVPQIVLYDRPSWMIGYLSLVPLCDRTQDSCFPGCTFVQTRATLRVAFTDGSSRSAWDAFLEFADRMFRVVVRITSAQGRMTAVGFDMVANVWSMVDPNAQKVEIHGDVQTDQIYHCEKE